MGNLFSFCVLGVWVLVSIRLYQVKSLQSATLWTVVGALLILPVKTTVNIPLIPGSGKQIISVLLVIFCCWVIRNKAITLFFDKNLSSVFILVALVGVFITTILNSDNLIVGGYFLPGQDMHDAVVLSINLFLQIVLFFVGKKLFQSYQDELAIFKFIAVAGLIYSIPILYEIRFSPQLHNFFYGYHPHVFGQQVRGGGFRPMVFIGHGLLVSFFMACVVISSAALWQIRERISVFSPAIVSYYLLIILFLCKSKAALLYGLVAFFAIKKISLQNQMRIAAAMALLTLLYPAMSIVHIFPHQKIIEIAKSTVGEDRSKSLMFRFENEEILLNHARERLFFGWGGWGRNRVFDDVTGQDISVTDGHWIITFGTWGLVGFLAEFGLLANSIFRAKRAARYLKNRQENVLLVAHALLVGIVMIDQLPNSSLAPWLWLVAGALQGRADNIIHEKAKV